MQGAVQRRLQSRRSSARLVLGARLRGLREAAGISPEEAAQAIRGSRSKISRLEHGRTGFKARDMADLLTCYGVSDMAERATLLELAEHANADSWWQAYGDVVPAWLEQYLDMERVACLIRAYEAQHVPGLLQTGDYARAVLRSGLPGAAPARRSSAGPNCGCFASRCCTAPARPACGS